MKCPPAVRGRGKAGYSLRKNSRCSLRSRKYSKSKRNSISPTASDSNSSLIQSVGLPLVNEDLMEEVELLSAHRNFSISQQSVTGGGVQRSTSVHSAQVTTERNSPTLLSASSLPTVTRVIPTRTSPGSYFSPSSCDPPMEPVASPELLEECTQPVSEVHTDICPTSNVMEETTATPFKPSNDNEVTNSFMIRT